MKKICIFLFVFALCLATTVTAQRKITNEDSRRILKQRVDTRVDNMKYWNGLVQRGILEANPVKFIPAADNRGSKMARNTRVITEDSPDVPTTTVSSTQSENSIFVSPVDNDVVLNSNNSTSLDASTLYGANFLTTMNGGETWGGSVQGAGGENSGDPTTCISLDNRWYVNFIHSNYGQGVAYSTNNGVSWTPKLVAPSPGGSGMLDKNHMWIDNSPSSPFVGNLYTAWTNFGGANDTEIEIARTVNGGATWATPIKISGAINAGSHNQGVNIQTGPAGQVYAVWAIYDSWPSDESAMGFAKSTNGGVSYAPATRIISTIRGIRTTETSKDHRVNSFPSMAVDISGGAYNGNIYVVWANIGVPHTNTGTNVSVYMIKSSNEGTTWSTPIRVNQDAFTNGKTHYMPWITCDPVSGTLSCIFYDDRNTTTSKNEVWVANSFDGGATWEDMKISDIAFEPHAIAGLAGGYMGDYLGISAYNRKVYPVWTDNRSGHCLSYTSPYETGPAPGQAYIIYNSVLINDTLGNNDGALDFGETASLSFALKNIGDMPADSVTVSISTESPYVTLLDSIEFFGDFTNPDTVLVENAFGLQIADYVPDGSKAKFLISTTDGDSIWYSNFTLIINAPKLEIADVVVSDPLPLGNNNSKLDPGETAILKVGTKNTGNFAAMNTICNLHSTNPKFHIVNNSYTIDSLPKQSTMQAEYTVSLDSSATIGSYLDLICDATSGLYSTSNILYQPIGNITMVENFESGNFLHYDWQLEGTPVWKIVTSGGHSQPKCAKSGAIPDDGSTSLLITMNVFFNDSISFWRKVSSENNYDYLTFYIDDEQIEQWSGNQPWAKKQYPVTQGSHTFKWTYAKDGSTTSGNDCSWLDDIKFPPSLAQNMPLTVTAIAYDSTLCQGNNSQLYAVSMGGGNETPTYTWTPTTGLSNPSIHNPVATPNTTTTYTITVTKGTQSTSSLVNVFVNPYPVISLGNDTNICAGTSYVLTPGLDFGLYLWNDSTMESSVSVDTIGTYSVLVVDTFGCISNIDSINIGLNALPVVNLGENAMICEGSTSTLDAGLDYVSYLWSDSSSTQTYTVSDAGTYSVVVVDSLGCISLPDSITFGKYPRPTISLGNDTTMKIYGAPLVIHAGDYSSYLWSDNTTGESLVLAPSVFTEEFKLYSVIVTDQNGCTNSDTIKVTFINNIGVDGIGAKMESVEALPNPSTGKFNLSINGLHGSKTEISILNIHGQSVYNETIDINGAISVNKVIDISSKPKGMYIMSVRNGNLMKIIKIQLQ